jgi:hypothetical protein
VTWLFCPCDSATAGVCSAVWGFPTCYIIRNFLSIVCVAAAQALAVDPPRGKHMVHSNLSAAYLQSGKKEAALQHAQEAVALAPKGFYMVSSSCRRCQRRLGADTLRVAASQCNMMHKQAFICQCSAAC